VLAFGLGLVLGMTFDTVPAAAPAVVEERADARAVDTRTADEPTFAEQREAAMHAEPHTETVGTHADRNRVPERMD
jgi:hypothetical protein